MKCRIGTRRGSRRNRGRTGAGHTDGDAVVSKVYDPLIRKAAAEHGVDASLVRAVIQVESAYQPRARSSKGGGFDG